MSSQTKYLLEESRLPHQWYNMNADMPVTPPPVLHPQISALVEGGYIEARAVNQLETFRAALTFARTEGIIPAPEPTHAIAVAIEEALKCRENGKEKVIVFNLCGHGHFDMAAYEAYLHGQLENYEYPEEEITEAMTGLPGIII